MTQAITTKYLGPTNYCDARVKARTQAGHHLMVAWDHARSPGENHAAAAQALAGELGWSGSWYGGGTEDGYAFVCDNGHAFDID